MFMLLMTPTVSCYAIPTAHGKNVKKTLKENILFSSLIRINTTNALCAI